MAALALLLACGLAGTAQAQLDQVRFGNLHAHTSYSDGKGTPEDAYRMACDASLDFFAVTEHNHAAADGSGDRRDGIVIATRPELYNGASNSLVAMADRLDAAGRCVTLYGQEFSTISSGNHVNVFDVGEVITVPNGRYDLLLAWLAAHPDMAGEGPLLQFNHPAGGRRAAKDYGRDDFGAGDEQSWVQNIAPHVSLIEMLNAPALRPGEHQPVHERAGQYFHYLNLGFHLAPSVGQDNHYENWGTSTDARVAVITPEFSRRGIIRALRARHAYASEDKNLRVVFRSGSALQGDITQPPAPGAELPLTVQIADADEPDALYRIEVFKDVAGGKPASAPVETYEVSGDQLTPLALDGVRFEAPGEYVLLRITQSGNEDAEHVEIDRLWTAPIWFEPASFHPAGASLPRLRIVELLPDPVGDDLTGERVTLRNMGAASIDLTGWRVRDLAGNSWVLDSLATLAGGQTAPLLRDRQPMSLNNGGDEIELVAPHGTVVQTISYGPVSAGELVTVDNGEP